MPWGVAAAVGGAVVSGIASNKAADTAADAQNAATAANAYQGQIATDEYNDYKTTYQPLEQSMVAQAQNYDTPAAYDKAAADAQATTSQQIGAAQDRLARTPGLDPTSAAAQAGQTNLALQGAALGAGNQNAARTNIQNTAWARKMDALGLGKGLVTNASNSLNQNAQTAAGLSSIASAQAGKTASSVGSAFSGIANSLQNANWGSLGGSSPSPGNITSNFTMPEVGAGSGGDTSALGDLGWMSSINQ